MVTIPYIEFFYDFCLESLALESRQAAGLGRRTFDCGGVIQHSATYLKPVIDVSN